MRSVVMAIMIGAVLIGAGIGVAMFGMRGSSPLGLAPAPTPTVVRPRAGGASRDLGTQSTNYGSQAQAKELLALMAEANDRVSYRVTYQTSADIVIVEADVVADQLTRTHQLGTGHGSREGWQGYVVDRLKSAAGGGSLNDTPAGKSFAASGNF